MRTTTSTLKAIVFDFDGVILESLDIKARAFAELFRDYPDHVDAIVRLHREHHGVSRFEKFQIIYRDFLQRPLTDSETAVLDQRFSQLVYDEIMECPFVPGAREFLEQAAQRYALYVASATPEQELRRIVCGRRLDPYFRGVFGSPRTKAEILSSVLAREGLEPHEVVFLGDAITDYDGAMKNAVLFIGRVPPGQPNPFENRGVEVVADLAQLHEEWGRIIPHVEEPGP